MPEPEPSSALVRDAARLARTARPSAPPIMNEVLTIPEASPASLGARVAHRGEQDRVERHAGADAEQEHARQHVGGEAAVQGRPREQEHPATRTAARRRAAADPEAHDQPRREPDREGAHDQVRRQEGEADLKRAVVQHELQVERREEEPREHRRRPQHADDVRRGQVAQPQQRERQERRADARSTITNIASSARRAEQAERAADVQPRGYR